ncbi:MAG: S1C family serine protease, partial [Micropepsaceae bacterium]
MRFAVALAAALVSFGIAHAEPPATMPGVPQPGRDAAAPAAPLPDLSQMGGGPGGVSPERLEQVLRRAATGVPPVFRGPAEQAMFLRFARSVALIVTKTTLGSGAVVHPDGTILTSARAVAGAKSVGVIFKPLRPGVLPRESDAVKAIVVRVDAIADLALIRVAKLPSDIQPLPIGDAAALRAGVPVHAIGHPFGEIWSYAKGVVRGVQRNFVWTAGDGSGHRADVVQLQMPASTGDTGGPVLNDAGQLVGVATSGRIAEASLAIASSEARRVLAMTSDRAALKAQAAEVPRARSCAPVRTAAKRTQREDATMVFFDGDCNGRPDTTLVVPDNRGQATLMMVDRNENGRTDAVYVDQNNDMRFDYVLYDTNEDGRTDLIGYDLDDALEPARIVLAR